MIFTWSQPCRISSRTVRRTSAVPSARHMANASASQHGQRTPRSVRRRLSEWPPVGPMARPATKSLGPAISPSSTAWRKPQSAPPVSRIEVKPRSSEAPSDAIACAVISVTGWLSSLPRETSFSTTCTWQSISPGISVRPPQSTTSAPSALIGRSLTSRISLPSTSSSWPPTRSSRSGSSISKFRNRICDMRSALRAPAGTYGEQDTERRRGATPFSEIRAIRRKGARRTPCMAAAAQE